MTRTTFDDTLVSSPAERKSVMELVKVCGGAFPDTFDTVDSFVIALREDETITKAQRLVIFARAGKISAELAMRRREAEPPLNDMVG